MRIQPWQLEKMTIGEKLERLERFVSDFKSLDKKPMKNALDDLRDMQLDDVEDASNILDQLHFDLKDHFPTRYTDHEEPDQQRILNAELESVGA